MNRLQVDEEIGYYMYANPDGCLSEEDRNHFLTEIVRMDKNGEKHKEIKGKDYEAIISLGKYNLIGYFGGMEYNTKLETNRGKTKCSVLVARLFDPRCN